MSSGAMGRVTGSAAAAIVGLACLTGAAAPSPAAGQEPHLLVVTGLGGAPEYQARFAEWGSGLVAAAREAGVRDVVWLAERDGLDPAVDGVARTEAVRGAIAAVAERAGPRDPVVLVVFGHGSARDGGATVNLPGPDLSAGELAVWLDPLAPRPVVVVNAASASGGFVGPLSAPGRVVITATRHERETQATRFGGHFVRALVDDAGDVDKDGRVSMLEAFQFARREVAREFESSNALATEHPLLDGDGDGTGSLEPGEAEGRLAASISLSGRVGAAVASGAAGAGGVDTAAADPALRALLAEKARLERELAELRAREGELEEAEYQRRLEALLLEVARNGRAIREHGGGDG